ncbi:Aminopeptidase N [Pirellulimonas nuda]|uniref:Aminopeptidase N n=1 Tax=Pirellulimonas nuda TaxID=2528009 RepID=A0A518D5X1_9BACT|nr:M1 family aminopeptidase [Pirellulimonas nuda]QDU86867.1 Aminopeptidase N [Pirellulimonas nuda]
MPFRLILCFVLAVAASATQALAYEEACVCRYCQQARALAERGAPGPDVPEDADTGSKFAPDRVVDVKRIAIDVTPDFKQRTIEGTTTITFDPIGAKVREVVLDAVDLRIESVEATQEIEEYVSTDKKLTILFKQPLKNGEDASVTVKYTAEPKQGLYFRTPELGYPEGDTHIWTQGETHEAPHWFPCFDYPNERSITEVTCRVPEGMTVVSNGKKVGEKVDAKTGLKAVHWVQEKPHVSYLVCLVAGNFHKLEDKHNDTPLGFYTQPSLAEHAPNAFADTRKIMAFYEEEIGVPFPWVKYDQATILDFTSGGMENTSLTTLTDRTVNPKSITEVRPSYGLDAHEMAHQWFGDLVTCKDWSHLWLNEGFATFYTHLYAGHQYGRDEMLYGLYRDATGRVLSETKDTRPIVYRDYKDAWEQFDFRAYPKGSWVLYMLRCQLGEDVYRQAITSYLKRHQLSSVVTAELIEELENTSGKSLDRFFDQWVFHGGTPSLKVTYKWLPEDKLAHVNVKQTQEVSDKVRLFHLPSKLRFYVDGEPTDHQVEITGKEQDFYVPLTGKPELVRFDPAYTLLATVDFKLPQEMLEKQLENKDDMIGRLLAAEALSKEDNHKSVAALRKALNEDPFYGVRKAASEALRKLHTDEAYTALAESLDQPDPRVRLAVVEDLGKWYRPETLRRLRSVVENEENPMIVAAAVRAAGKFGGEGAQRLVARAIDEESFRNIVASAAIEAAGDLANPRLAEAALKKLETSRHGFSDRDYGAALKTTAGLYRDKKEKAPARKLIESALTDPSTAVRGAAIEALGELRDPQAIPALNTLTGVEHPRYAGAAKKAIEKIEQETPLTPQEVSELRKLVRELQEQSDKLKESVDSLKEKKEAKGEEGEDEESED